MKKRNVIVSAVLTIALCLGIMTGSTYALFTDKSTPVNVAVESATVDIEANVANFKYFSYDSNYVNPSDATDKYALIGTLADGEDGEFTNKGTVSVTGNEIVLDRVTPGDKVEFDIVVTNKSNVKTQIRTLFSTEEPAGQQTIFANDGIVITSTVGSVNLSDTPVVLDPANDPNGEVVRTIHVVIDFVYLMADQNHHQNKSDIKISYLVEAVQYNGAFAN